MRNRNITVDNRVICAVCGNSIHRNSLARHLKTVHDVTGKSKQFVATKDIVDNPLANEITQEILENNCEAEEVKERSIITFKVGESTKVCEIINKSGNNSKAGEKWNARDNNTGEIFTLDLKAMRAAGNVVKNCGQVTQNEC